MAARKRKVRTKGLGFLGKALADLRPRVQSEVQKAYERGLEELKTFSHPRCRCTSIALGPEVQRISKDVDTRSYIDCGDFQVPGLHRAGEIKLEGVFGSTAESLLRSWQKGEDTFRVDFPDGKVYEFRGFVTNYRTEPSVDGLASATVTIQPTGRVKEKKMIPKKMPAGLKAFYVGSNNLTADWTHATLKDAIKHGQKLVDKDGYEEVFVVEIKKVVRRKAQPVVVENFKAKK